MRTGWHIQSLSKLTAGRVMIFRTVAFYRKTILQIVLFPKEGMSPTCPYGFFTILTEVMLF